MEKKTVILAVTGSIAAYKMANVASMLTKLGADVHVILTKNGAEFITPVTFETITGNKCLMDTFDRNFKFDVTHISLAKKADILLIAPASANIIGKLAHGIADDMLSTTALACQCKKMFAPAMNTNMYQNAIVQKNMAELENFGFEKIEPASGRLACGDVGLGKLPSEETLVQHIVASFQENKNFLGKKIVITAGATQESLDPVRFITNHSTGKMGYAIAETAVKQGADVVLISGKTHLAPVSGAEMIPVTSAEDMFQAVKSIKNWDILIKTAAVADYRPKHFNENKMKKTGESLVLELERTQDILKFMGEQKQNHQFICGFSMETQNMLENSRIKLEKKKIDMIIANNLKQNGAGFGGDTNIVTIITQDQEKQLDLMPKSQVAHEILKEIHKKLERLGHI